MRNPNGYGTIEKLSGNRRKPYGVRVTIGWDDVNDVPIRKYLSYFELAKDAQIFLAKYNENPYLYLNKQTFEQVYESWSATKYPTIAESSVNTYTNAFSYCSSLLKLEMIDIKLIHLQNAVDSADDKYPTKCKIISFLNQVCDYAMKNDIIMKDYSKFLTPGVNNQESSSSPFSKDEIDRLWQAYNDGIKWVDVVLMLIYTGFRIGAFLNIKLSDINMEEKYIIGGIKTEAGKNRIVPIHHKIYPIIEKIIAENKSEYLVYNHKYNKMTYSNFQRDKFMKLMDFLDMKHTIHDTRHTFATLLNNADANHTSIKKLVGHKNFTTTEKIYTHKDIEELRKAVEKIK